MTDSPQLDRPWLIAVWPGMGHVALSAGYYLMSKLGMSQFAELTEDELFDVDGAMVKDGLVQRPHRPRSRLFAWKAPPGGRDVIVFIGESQPQLGKLAFCERLIDLARDQDVERLFTFAAMATEMQPGTIVSRDPDCRGAPAGPEQVCGPKRLSGRAHVVVIG